MFSVRLVKADYYMSTPIPGLDARYSEFRGVEVKQVPVIRIFGSTVSGHKVCLHIHGVFPYIYIPYDGCIEKEKFIYQIASAIDKALNVSLGSSNSHTQHVYKVTHVSAIPFYGYHSQNHQFLKLYFYNPHMIKKASDLLQNGVILGQVFQPHEAHIPFILQFCMDYNLHGMSFVNLATVRYRQGVIEGSNYKPAPLENVPEEFLLPEHILRISTCSLEVDGVAADILNQRDISGQLTSNPGLKAIWDEEKERRRKENRNSQFTPQNTQTRQPPPTASEKFHLGRLKKRLSEAALVNENSKTVMEKSPSGEKPKPYPAPSPEGEDHLNASVLLTHVNSLCHENDSEKSAEEKLNVTQFEDLDKTGMYAHSNSSDSEVMSSQSSVLNSQCISLVQILQDLIEDDSVLGSQQQEADEEDIERESDDEVLSQSFDCKEPESGNAPDSPLRSCGTRRGQDSGSSSTQDRFVLLQVDGANDVLKEEEDMNQTQLHQETRPVQQELLNPALPESEMYCDTGVLPLLSCDESLPLTVEPEILPENDLQVQTGSDVDCKEDGMKIGASLPLELSDNTDDFTNEHSEDYLLSIEQCNEEKSGYFSEPVSIDSAVGTDKDGLVKCLLLGDPWLTAQPASSEKDEFLDENFSSSLKDPWTIDTENSSWIPGSEKYFSETSMITLPEVDVSSQYETADFAELSVNKKTEPNSVTSSETKRRLCSLIKSRTKAREAQSSDKMSSELISVDEIVNSEATCVNEYENSTYSTIFQGSDYEPYLDDSCSILNGVEGSFLNESGLGSDMKILGSSAIEEFNKSKDELLDDMCNRLREGLGAAVFDHTRNTSKPKRVPLFPHLNKNKDEAVARQWLLESRNGGGLRDNLHNSKVNCNVPGSRRRGRKPKWLKELEMKLSSFEQVEEVKKKVENNYQLRNRGLNAYKKGKNPKHLNEQVKTNQYECASAKVSESLVENQDTKSVDNRSVKERLGILVRNSIGKKHSGKESSLEEGDCSRNIPSQKNNQSLGTSLATETPVHYEKYVLPGISSDLHETKKEEKLYRSNDSLQKVCQIKEKNECDDNKFDITATCLTELSLQFEEHEVNSSTVDIHETTPVVADNVKEDVELAKKRMGQYVRQRLGILVESRSKLCSKSTDEALALKVPNPVCETSDNCSKVLKRHHRNRRKVKSVQSVEIPISENVNISSDQNKLNNTSDKKSEMFSNYEKSDAINTCTDVSSSDKTTVLDSNSPIKSNAVDAISHIVNSASFINTSTIGSSLSLENELQSSSILNLEEKETTKESSKLPDSQYSQSLEDLLNVYSIQKCYVKLQKFNLNEWKKVNTFESVDEINSFKSARRKTSLNLHDENLMNTANGQRSSENIYENDLIKTIRNEKDVDSYNFQSVILSNAASGYVPSLFDHNKRLHCSESNMKCVVPNSPKSLDKNIRKTGDLGSLKAVVQAESPRVADTLDTLPDNPAQAIRHYALGGGTFIDPTENQSVHLGSHYLRDSNIVEVAKIPAICYAENGSDKMSEENDLPNIINDCSTSIETEENITNNEDVDAFKNSDCEFLTFTRGCLRKRSLINDENYMNKREKISEAKPSNISNVIPNDANLPKLESQEVSFEGKSVEFISENTGKEILEDNCKNEFLNNRKRLNSNHNVVSQCPQKEFEESDLTRISSRILLPHVTEEISPLFLSKDQVSMTCLDKPQKEFSEQKIPRVTRTPVHQKMPSEKRKLQTVPKNASRTKSLSVSRLPKKLQAANKYRAIKPVSLKHSRRIESFKKSLSATQAENKWSSQNSSNEKINSNSKSYYNTCANHNTKWNSFPWSKRISSSYKPVYFETKPNAVEVKDKIADKIQLRQTSALNTNRDNKSDDLKESRRITRQSKAVWKNESDMKLQCAWKQPEAQNSEFKSPTIKGKLNSMDVEKSQNSPMRDTVPRVQRSCVVKKKLNSSKHCKRISLANLPISRVNDKDLPENLEEKTMKSEIEKVLSNSVKLKFEPFVNNSVEVLHINKTCKNIGGSTNVIKEPTAELSSENKLLEDELFCKETVVPIAPGAVFDKRITPFGLFQNTHFKKKCHRFGLNSSKHSRRITSSKRFNCTLTSNGLCESLEEKTKAENDTPFDISLVSDTLLSTDNEVLPTIVHENSSQMYPQSTSKVCSKLQLSGIQNANSKFLNVSVTNIAKTKVQKDSKSLPDGIMRRSKENRKAKLNSLKCLEKFTSVSTSVPGFNSKDCIEHVEMTGRGRETEQKDDDSAILMSAPTINIDNENFQGHKLLENGIICGNEKTLSKEQSTENLLGEIGMANNETGLQSALNVASDKTQPSGGLFRKTLHNKKHPTAMSNTLKRSKRIASAKQSISIHSEDVLDANTEVTISEVKPKENSSLALTSESSKDLTKNNEKIDRETELKEVESANLTAITAISGNENLQSSSLLKNGTICDNKITSSEEHSSENEIMGKIELTNNETSLQSASNVASHEKAQPSSCLYPTVQPNSLKRSERIASAKKSVSACSKDIVNENLEEITSEIKPEENSSIVLKLDRRKNRVFPNTTCRNSAAEERSTSKIQPGSPQADILGIQCKLKDKTVSSCDKTDLQSTQDLLSEKTRSVPSLLQNSHFNKNYTAVVKSLKRSKRIASAQNSNSTLNTDRLSENLEQKLGEEKDISLTVNLRSNSLLGENSEDLPNAALHENAAPGNILTVQSRLDHSVIKSVKNEILDNTMTPPEATGVLNTQENEALFKSPGRQKKQIKLRSVKQSKSLSSSKKSYSARSINRIFENLEQRTHRNVTSLLSLPTNSKELNSLEAQFQVDQIEIQRAKNKFCNTICPQSFENSGTTSSNDRACPVSKLHQKRRIHKKYADMTSSLKRSKRIGSVKKSIAGNSIMENFGTSTTTSPTERNVSIDSLLTNASMFSAKVEKEHVVNETIYQKEISDRESKIIPQSNSLCSLDQNNENEQISIMTASRNEISNCQNTPKYTTFRVNTRSSTGLKNHTETKHNASEKNSYLCSEKTLSIEKPTCQNFEEKSELATSTQSVSENIHSSQVPSTYGGNCESSLKNIRGKGIKSELVCDDKDTTVVRLKEKQNRMQSSENKSSSQIVSPLHPRVSENSLKRKSRFISKLHQKTDLNQKYHAVKLISVKRSARIASTHKIISVNQQNACKNFVGKANVDNHFKVKLHATKSKLKENAGDLQRVKISTSVSEGDKNKSDTCTESDLNPLEIQRKPLSASTLSLNPTSDTSKNSENTSTNKSLSKNASVHLKNPIVKLNLLNCLKMVPSVNSAINDYKNKTDDFERQFHVTKSSNVSMSIQERSLQFNEKVCNVRGRNKDSHCENEKICKSGQAMNVQCESNQSNLQIAECNQAFGRMITSNNSTNCQSTSIKKRHFGSTLHLKTHTNRKTLRNKLNQPKLFEEKDSFSELTHEQDLCDKDRVDEELKNTTKLKEVASNTRVKRNISTKNKRSDHTLQGIYEEATQSMGLSLESSKVVSSKSGIQSPLLNALPGGKRKTEKEGKAFAISEDVERVTAELQTSIPCVDGANDSVNSDNSSDFVPLTVTEQKIRKRSFRQVLNVNDLSNQEPSSIQNCDRKSTRQEGKNKRSVKDSPAKPSKRETFKPLDVENKRTSLYSKTLGTHQLHSSAQLAVGATEPEPMTQAILLKYLSSVLKRTVTKRDVNKFQPHLKLKRLNHIDIHSSRLKRRKLMNELRICVEHCAKGVSLDQHSERPQEMTLGCIHQGGHFAKVLCQQTGTDGDQQNLILINNEKTVIGNEALNSTFSDSYIETSNIKLQLPLLKSNTYASNLHSCGDHKPSSERKEAYAHKIRDISSASPASISPVNFRTKESRSDYLNELFVLNRETQSFLVKDDSCKNSLQECVTESLIPPNNSKLSTVNSTVPAKQNFVQSSLNRKSLNRNNIITPKKMPPSKKQIFQSLSDFNFPQHTFLKPFFGNASDIVERKEVGHKDLKIQSRSVKEIDLFESMIPNLKGLKSYKDEAIRNLWEHSQSSDGIETIFKQGNLKAALGGQRETILTPCSNPPSVKEVKLWAKALFLHKQKTRECKKHENEEAKRLKSLSQKDEGKLVQIPANSSQSSSQGLSDDNSLKATDSNSSSVSNLLAQTQFRQQLVTPQAGKSHDSLGFKMSYENLQDCRAVVEPQYLTLLAIELHIQTRGDLRPDPAHDSVCAIFYCVQNDVPQESLEPNLVTGMIVVENSTFKKAPLIHNIDVNCRISYVPDEKALMEEVIHLVQLWDPDILAGYEVEMLSWGYLFERAFVLEMNMCPLVSRIPGTRQGNKFDESVMELPEEFSLLGRIVLNVWRLMRHEVSLQSYTFENVSFHVLHERIPLVSFKTLTQWWGHRTRCFWGRVADHYLLRVRGLIRILEQLDLINRTSELARIFGIQFYEVLSRGSQFRVESMMLRLAKPMNYIPVSPSVQQRARMRAPEYLQLIMEPESQLYVDPVIVLDFQSLYPSMIIAYNYCFSTCLGRVEHLGQTSPFEFGSSHLLVPPEQIKQLLGNIHISPSGQVFVNSAVRKGIMPLMLEEILDTRLMVKKSMKEHKDDKTLQRVLHSRQLGLKLIANVTYGYTAANFSGRMACVEIADSVVSKGRETLERAIHLVENTAQWGARVVYGDTDSLFVLVPGRSREDAFAIGAEIAEAVTQDNPSPVKLKLEKVYQPCILQTKKRYVGYMYESANQKEPVYDAKGIETVRRDGCPAVAKVLEKSLHLLFETKDISKVKTYVQRKFSQILEGQMSIQDLTFAREYRGKGGYKPGACVPSLELTKRWLSVDPRAEPRVSERVPYIVISGAPNVPLIQLVRSPHDLLAEPGLKVHAHYYVSRVVCPPLARCFSLLGADVMSWYTDLPRRIVLSLPKSVSVEEHKKFTISQYFSTSNCAVCHQICQTGICSDCQKQPQITAVSLATKIHEWERHYYNLEKICQSCCRCIDKIECISLDCPVMYNRNQARHSMMQETFIQNLQDNLKCPEV